MSSLGSPPVYPDIVEEHFDELDWLWEQRDASLFSEDWTLRHLVEHEERAEAHLDGLRLSEFHGVEMAREKLEEAEPYAVAAATMVLFEGRDPGDRKRIMEAFQTGETETVLGVRAALRHLDLADFVSFLRERLSDSDPFRAASAGHILAFSRLPAPGLPALLEGKDAEVRILALGATARLGELHPRPIAAAVESPEPGIRRAGLEAAAILGVQGLIRHVRAAASRETDPDPEAVCFLGTLGYPEDVGLLQSLLQREELAPSAVEALGTMGRVEGVPPLLDLLDDPVLGGPAARAYRRITGATNVEEGDPEKARADWKKRKGTLAPGVAWQMGLAVPEGTFPAGNLDLTLQARKDLYLRIRSRVGTRGPDVELEALASRQMTSETPSP